MFSFQLVVTVVDKHSVSMLAYQRALVRQGAASLRRRLGNTNVVPTSFAGRRCKYIDARNQNQSPTAGLIRFIAIAPLGAIGVGIGAAYVACCRPLLTLLLLSCAVPGWVLDAFICGS